jgi:hypothetical protein
VPPGDLVVSLGDAALQIDSLALEAVGRSAADSPRGPVRIDPQEQSGVRPDPPGGEITYLLHPLHA